MLSLLKLTWYEDLQKQISKILLSYGKYEGRGAQIVNVTIFPILVSKKSTTTQVKKWKKFLT